MSEIWTTFINGFGGYASYLWHEITHPSWHNYFYWLLMVSAFFFGLEIIKPWRKNQPILRKDFWLDFFYMFFNFFLFSLLLRAPILKSQYRYRLNFEAKCEPGFAEQLS